MRSWSFNKKILLSGLIFVTAAVLIAAVGITALTQLVGANNNFAEKYNIERIISPLEHSAKRVSMLEMQSIIEPSEEKASLLPKQMLDAYGDWDNAASTLVRAVGDSQQQSRLSELRSLIGKRKELSELILKSALEGDTDQAFALHNTDETPARGLDERIQKVTAEIIQAERSAALQNARESSAQGHLWIYWLTLLSAAALAFALLLTQTLIAGLRKDLNRTSEGLLESADELLSTSQSAAQAGNKLSEKAATEASALEEMSVTVAQMISAVNAGAEHTKLFAEFAEEAGGHAARARDVGVRLEQAASETTKNTREIVRQIHLNKRQLEEFENFFAEFSEKSKAMTEFVFKTKLMSFNASLEAERAGENGKGFSLIAEELAELAETSGAAARELNAMLSGRLEQTAKIVSDSRAALEELAGNEAQTENETMAAVAECNKAMRELMEDSLRVARFARELRQASEAQALGFTELGKTIVEIEEMARQNAISSDSCAASSDDFAVRSINHRALVKKLSHLMNGQQASASHTHPQAENTEDAPAQGENETDPKTEKPRLLPFRGNNLRKEQRTARAQRFGQRSRSEDYMRKAAGAEDIPFEKE